MPDEMVDRGMPFGPKYVDIQQLADQAKSIRPAAKHVKAMKLRGELDATGLILSLEAVRAELAERQAEVDAEMTRLLAQVSLKDESPAKDRRTDPGTALRREG